MALALDLVHRHRQKLLDKLEFRRLDRWRQQFPPDVAAASSDLLLIGGWLNHLRFNVPDLNADLQRATALVAAMAPKAAGARELRGEIAALRSHQLLAAGEAGCAVTVAQQALADLPPSRFYVRSVAMVYLAWGYQMAGDVRRLEELFAAAEEPWLPWNLAALRTIQVRSYVELAAANLAPVMANAPHMLALAETGEFKTSIAWAHYFLGSACYLRNDLGRAAEHFAGVLDLVEFAHMRAYAHSVIGLALTQQALGQPQAAVATVTTAQEILADKGFYHARTLVDVFAAELAARQGRKEEAQRWITRASAYLLEDAIPLFYAPELAATRIQLATGDHDLDVAQVQLQQEKARALRTHNVHLQIQILALEAALHSRQDDPAQATVALEGALALAAGGQVVQVFADLAVELEPVCDRLTASRSLSPFAAQVCSVVRLARELQGGIAGPGAPGVYAVEFNAATVTETDTRTDGATQNTPGSAPDGEPDFEILLTYREIDVLKLLCARLTNKEIARELGIATETVRQHTVNLFRKLGVHNRRQAAVVARNKGYVGW